MPFGSCDSIPSHKEDYLLPISKMENRFGNGEQTPRKNINNGELKSSVNSDRNLNFSFDGVLTPPLKVNDIVSICVISDFKY